MLNKWTYILKSIRVHLRPTIAPEACLHKSLSLNQLAKIFVARGMRGDKRYSYFTLVFHLLRHQNNAHLCTQRIPCGVWHANTLLMGHTAIFGLVSCSAS